MTARKLEPLTPGPQRVRWLTALLPCLALGCPAAAQQTTPTQTGADAAAQDAAMSLTPTTSPYTPSPWVSPQQERLSPLPRSSSLGTSVFPSEEGLSTLRSTGIGRVPPMVSTEPTPPLRWGRVSFHPHVSYNLLYGTGILSGPGREEDTFLHTLSPGIMFQLGLRWTLDYTPSLQFYSNEAYEDTLDHAVTLNGTVLWSGWAFSLGCGYRSSNSPLIETAAQTDQDTHSLNVGASRYLSQRTSLELGFAQALRFTEAYTDSLSWSTTDWLNYQLNPKLAVAAGISVGYDVIDPGSDMTNERFLGRIRGQLGEKFSYSIEGGAERRQFLDTDAPTNLSPVVEGSLDYQLFETTSVSVFASHETGTSYYTDQFTESTRVGGGLQQRLLGKLYLNVSGGYSMENYASTFGPETSQREDDNVYFQAGLSTRMLKRLNLSVFYRYADNHSDQAAYSFDSNQVGFQLSYAF